MRKISLLFTLLLVAIMSSAVPARPGWQTVTQPDGTTLQVQLVGDEFHHYWIDHNGNQIRRNEAGLWQMTSEDETTTLQAAKQMAAARREAYQNQANASQMPPRGLVVLVNFNDVSYQAANTRAGLYEMMNGDNYTYDGATGSIRKYFSDQSDGKYTPDFDVVGPVTLPKNVSYYGGNDSNGKDLKPGDMVVEACSIANANFDVDFTRYDSDNDGAVDFVYIIYAGKGEADGGGENTIWPHAWDIASAHYFGNSSYSTEQSVFDGVIVSKYACSGEIDGHTGKRTGIGTIAHEYSHVIGLPDLYDIDYGQNHTNQMTPNTWHLMDAGSYNNNGKTPPNYSTYDKYYLGWKTPSLLSGTQENVELIAVCRDGYEGYQLSSNSALQSATSTAPIYYIENRQQSGWDEYTPGHGLLIWKVTYNKDVWAANGPNDTNGVLRYALISASGNTKNIGSDADPFPGRLGVKVWSDKSAHTIKDITENNEKISITYTKTESGEPSDPNAPIVIKAKVPTTWTEDITLWVWPTGGEGKVVTPTKEGDWYVYTHHGSEVNIIFRNGTDWNGDTNQTIDMYFTQSACIEIVPIEEQKADYRYVDCGPGTTDPTDKIVIKAKVPATWTEDITLWVWPTGGEGEVVTPTKEGDWYVYTHQGSEVNIIYRNGTDWNGDTNQTIDMYFTQSACIEIVSNGEQKADYRYVDCEPGTTDPAGTIVVKAKVPATWTNEITLWVWPTGGEGEVVTPTKEGDWYVYTHQGSEVNIIYRNGTDWNGDANQTVDMYFTQSVCIEITSDGVQKANYTYVDCEVASYEIVVIYNKEYGTVTGAGTYKHGETVTLTAIANTGYEFAQWSDGSKNNPYTFVAEKNVNIEAQFIPTTAVEDIYLDGELKVQKIIRNNQLLIIRDGEIYDVYGNKL